MKPEIKTVEEKLRQIVKDVEGGGKIGESILKPLVAKGLRNSGFDVDEEDTMHFFPAGLSAWRDKESEKISETRGRLGIDLVVRYNREVIALVETESDLKDLRENGYTHRPGHYDVLSIACNARGQWFHSYKSLERMAVAAFIASDRPHKRLEQLKSNSPADHNPSGIGIFLVTGSSRLLDRRILAPRLASLDARLISLTEPF